mmetsp:Transcript_7054/g.8929  ORF Transcript_7054/g.8929 Transcript_7054/m.8929 type:complete len:197 (-) Transcript_7054:376-966(-)
MKVSFSRSSLFLICITIRSSYSFTFPHHQTSPASIYSTNYNDRVINPFLTRSVSITGKRKLVSTHLNAEDDSNEVINLRPSDQVTLGVIGTFMSTVMLWSEFVLKSTGCGLPAGPFGLVGAVEGLSYLGVTGLVSFSIYKKIKTGSGLPAGPYGILGAAEGLSFLAILAGIAVLILQVANYGYIPNAVPMDGGMCQ